MLDAKVKLQINLLNVFMLSGQVLCITHIQSERSNLSVAHLFHVGVHL